MRCALRLSGLYWRGRHNAARVRVRHNLVRLPTLPTAFAGYTILHISDMHVEMNPGAMKRLCELLPGLADEVFHRGALGLAQLNSAAGIGAFITPFWLAQRGHVRGITSAAIWGLLISGIAVLVFSSTDIFAIGLAMTLLAGATIEAELGQQELSMEETFVSFIEMERMANV